MEILKIFAALTGGLAILGGACVLPIILAFKAERRKRELDHIERMKAIEMGRPYPGEEQKSRWAVPYQIAASIGAGVPTVAFGCAWLATMKVGYHEAIWIPVAIVGLGSVISGSVLATTVFTRSEATGEFGSNAFARTGKPYIAEDEYDVISSRG